MNMNLTMIAQGIEFFLFIWLAKVAIWPWMIDKIETRQKMIADGLAEGERGRSSLAEAQVETERLLKAARERAHEIAAQAERTANQRIEDAKAQAKSEGERLVASAKAQIEQEVQSARQQLREQVALLAVSGAEKILRREVDAGAHAAMLEQLKAQL